jgi:hypothetical protein
MNSRFKKSQSLNLRLAGVKSSGLLLLFLGLCPAFSAQQTNTFVRPDYSTFKLVNDRNIFNSKRSRDYKEPDGPVQARRIAKSESFALVGTMNQGSGLMAFFEGTKSDYRKVLKHEETIAGFKVAEIQPSFVKLASPTNELELRIGMQLAREEEGPWRVSARPESFEPSAPSTSSRSSTRASSNGRSSKSSPTRSGDNQNSLTDILGSLPFNPNAIFPGGPGDQQPQPAINNALPSTGSGSAEDILAALRRRREQENNP